MGRVFKKILVGAVFALILFLITVFFFGERRTITIPFAKETFIFGGETPTLLTPEYNLTRALGENLIESIATKSPENDPSIKTPLIALDAEATVQKTLENQLANFNQDDFWPVFNETSLPIVRPATVDAERSYLQSLQNLFATLSQSRLNQDNMRATDFSAMAKAREVAFAALYETPVPESLLAIHLDMLDLLGAQSNVYKILSNYQNDPLKALMALEFQKQLLTMGEETESHLTDYLKQSKLTL